MAKGHRSQIKRLRNENKDTRPKATVSYARVSVQKACFVSLTAFLSLFIWDLCPFAMD